MNRNPTERKDTSDIEFLTTGLTRLARSRTSREVTLVDIMDIARMANLDSGGAAIAIQRLAHHGFTQLFRNADQSMNIDQRYVARKLKMYRVGEEDEDPEWVNWAKQIRVVWKLDDESKCTTDLME